MKHGICIVIIVDKSEIEKNIVNYQGNDGDNYKGVL